MSWPQFVEWAVYGRLDPFGEERADLRAALITAKIHNVNVTKKSDLASPADFMPNFGAATGKPPKSRRRPMDEEAWKEFRGSMEAAAAGTLAKPPLKIKTAGRVLTVEDSIEDLLNETEPEDL